MNSTYLQEAYRAEGESIFHTFRRFLQRRRNAKKKRLWDAAAENAYAEQTRALRIERALVMASSGHAPI